MKRFLPLAGLILILQVLAFLTSYFVTESAVNGWYQAIEKSSLNPPDWVFAPVWTTLYIILAVSLWMLWRGRQNPTIKKALGFFLAQLVLNYSWSFVFFSLRAFSAAFWLLIVIDLLTIAAMVLAWSHKCRVSLMLLPYLAWIGFATYLTYAVMRLN